MSENEEAWFFAINIIEMVPEIVLSPPKKSNLQQVDICHEQIQDHYIKRDKDIMQSGVQLSRSQKQREPQLVKKLLKVNEKLPVNNKGVLMRRTVNADQIVVSLTNVKNCIRRWVI